MLWVYDLDGLDQVEWASCAAAELATTAQHGDTVLLLVGARDSPGRAALETALTAAGFAVRWEADAGQPTLRVDV